MAEMLIIGGFWFWTIVLVEIVLLFVFVEKENGIGATLALIVFLLLMQFGFKVDLVEFVTKNPIRSIAAIAMYLFIGVSWGTLKWRLFCGDKLEEYTNRKISFLDEKGISGTTIPDNLKAEWKKIVDGTSNYKLNNRTIADSPLIRHNKARWMRWASMWPISLMWSMLHDLVLRVWNTIYKRITIFLQGISDSLFNRSTIKQDLE